MPLYDFKSPCGRTFEALTPASVTPKCPCGSPSCAPERQVAAPGAIVFKGEGFYRPGASVR